MNPDKLKHATALIRAFKGPAALLCSFGKDSTALLHLIREVLPKPNDLACHAYPIPVIYHRTPYFSAKHEFADSIIRSWALEIHDYPPLACGVKCKDDRLELVARYPFGLSALDLPLNTEPPIARRDFVCGLEWLKRPKLAGLSWPWATIFIGHKSSDLDPFEGQLPLKHDAALVGGVSLVFPLRHWTDADVWEYIEEHHVPYDKRRYAKRENPRISDGNVNEIRIRKYENVADTWLNPDHLHACTACVDPRETAQQVKCPKTGGMVPNWGPQVLRLEELPDYINKEQQMETVK
jgi:hypothetical protein